MLLSQYTCEREGECRVAAVVGIAVGECTVTWFHSESSVFHAIDFNLSQSLFFCGVLKKIVRFGYLEKNNSHKHFNGEISFMEYF